MASPFPRANAEVDYPLYAVDFDPEDASRIVVGGGGGVGRSGVPNKISVLETTSPTELRVAAELDLSRDEDSVMSLAVAGRKGKTINIFAGINSSPESIEKGKNDHLRSIAIKGISSSTRVTEEARHPLFANPAGDIYQRLLRVSGTLGAAGSAFGKDPQIALFDIPGSTGGNLVRRGTIELPKDAEDLDVVQVADGSHLLVYCYKYELYLVKAGKEQEDPQLIYSIPADEPNRPAFRSVRFLGPEFLLVVANLPARSGVAIHGLRLPKAGQEKARLAVSAKIPRKIAATAVAVANLSRPTRSAFGGTESLGDTQFVIAVAGHDSSISLFSLMHVASPVINLLTKLHPLSTLKAVHGEDNITGLALSTFSPPSTKTASSAQQYLKLVSTSLQKTIALHSIPLKKFVDQTPRTKNAPPRSARYVTALDARAPTTARTAIVLFSFVVLILAVVGQSIMVFFGQGYPVLSPQRFIPGLSRPSTTPVAAPIVQQDDAAPIVQQDDAAPTVEQDDAAPTVEQDDAAPIVEQDDAAPIAQQHDAAPVIAEVDTASLLKDDFLAKVGGGGYDPSETLVIYAPVAEDGSTEEVAGDIKLEVHDEKLHGAGKTWEELPEEQQHQWKARLRDAGAWTQSMGENVFKGVLFGELGGAIGHAVAG